MSEAPLRADGVLGVRLLVEGAGGVAEQRGVPVIGHGVAVPLGLVPGFFAARSLERGVLPAGRFEKFF